MRSDQKPIHYPSQGFSLLKQLTALLGWTRSSYYLMSAFVAIIFLIIIVWWPLAEEYLSYIDNHYPIWLQIDWLLLGIFAVMSLLIMAGANIKADAWIVIVGLFGGLVIESWGTQTNLWIYYTNERPPLWIIPAWPIASLSIDRIVHFLNRRLPSQPIILFRVAYWLTFTGFYTLMIFFAQHTFDKSLTWMALLLCALLILSPTDHRLAVFTFVSGSGLGYFLELWGTTRACWTYYTLQTPPLFAILAHGFAAVAFWRGGLLTKKILITLSRRTGLGKSFGTLFEN